MRNIINNGALLRLKNREIFIIIFIIIIIIIIIITTTTTTVAAVQWDRCNCGLLLVHYHDDGIQWRVWGAGGMRTHSEEPRLWQ